MSEKRQETDRPRTGREKAVDEWISGRLDVSHVSSLARVGTDYHTLLLIDIMISAMMIGHIIIYIQPIQPPDAGATTVNRHDPLTLR